MTLLRRLLAVALTMGVAPGCAGPGTIGPAAPVDTGAGEVVEDGPPDPATGSLDLVPDCGPRMLDDADYGCIPEMCGSGTWGELDTDAYDWFVQADAAEGGDGSVDAPFQTIGEAVVAVGTNGAIAVAAGAYVEAIRLDMVEDVELAGRCPALVTMEDPSTDIGGSFAYKLWAPGGRGLLRGVRVRGNSAGAIVASGGALTVEDVEVFDTRLFGIVAIGEDDPLVLRRVVVTGTPRFDENSDGGGGIVTTSNTRLIGEDIQVIQPHGIGVHAIGGEMELQDVTILDVQRSFGFEATGIVAYNGGVIDCTRCLVDGSDGYGVQSRAYFRPEEPARLILRDSTVRGAAGTTTSEEDYAIGVNIRDGGVVEADGLVVEAVLGDGIQVWGDLSRLEGHGVTIRDVRAPEGERGLFAAMRARTGGRIDISEVLVEDVAGWALVVRDEASAARLAGVVVQSVGLDGGDAQIGGGLRVSDGATLDAADVSLSDIIGVGLSAADATMSVDDWDITTLHPTLTLESTGARVGPAVVSLDSTLGLSGFAVDEAVGAAVLVSGGTTTIDGLTVDGTAAAETTAAPDDLLFGGGAVVTGSRITLSSTLANGVQVADEGTEVALSDCALTASGGVGAVVRAGAALSLSHCTLTRRTAIGVVADGDGTTLDLAGVDVEDTSDGPRARYAVGVGVLSGSAATIEGTEVADTAGVGLLVVDATAACTDCTIARSEGVGVYTLAGALDLVDGEIIDTVNVSAVGGYGLFGDDATVTAAGTAVSGHPTVAAWVRGSDSRWTVDGAEIRGGALWPWRAGLSIHGDALVASAGVPADGLRVTGTTLADAQGAGLFLDASSATLSDITWADNATDLVRQSCDGVESVAGESGTTSTIDCPDASLLMLDPDLSFFVDLGGILDE